MPHDALASRHVASLLIASHQLQKHVITCIAKNWPISRNLIQPLQPRKNLRMFAYPSLNVGGWYKESNRAARPQLEPGRKSSTNITNRRIRDLNGYVSNLRRSLAGEPSTSFPRFAVKEIPEEFRNAHSAPKT